MARPKTHSERMIILERIIGLVKEQGRITTNDVVAIFGVHRTTAEKYLRIALERGGFIRHGRCGIFRDQRAVIDYDLRRYSSSQVTGFLALPVLEKSPVMQVYGASKMSITMSNIDKRALREVAERATPGNWRRTSSLFNGITVTPFSLCGEEVTLAHTVEKRDAEFIAAANPATMLALLDELETKEEQRANWFRMAQKLGEDLDTAERLIAELDQRLIEYAGIATREARRVAELEARKVNLSKLSVGEVMHMSGFSRDYAEGWCAGNDNAIHEIRTAGIKVKES
ncbi:DUF977 family protein [Salmonella enterica subsp. enterica]|nr:hypothetical protein [Salmonella enterica subsp. enterica serovar Lexington]EDV3725897.1 DUF977 family protein [Salmonella enterica subsp. enterica]